MNSPARDELNSYMTRLCDGDRSAFDFIFDAAWPITHRFAAKSLGTSHDAEDVAQHALMKVFSRASEFRRGSDALSWILTITAYECKTWRKSKVRRKEEFERENSLDQHSDDRASVEDDIIKKSVERAVRETLGELNIQDQETILASIDEALRPDIAAATYRKRLERALDRLRQQWSRKYE